MLLVYSRTNAGIRIPELSHCTRTERSGTGKGSLRTSRDILQIFKKVGFIFGGVELQVFFNLQYKPLGSERFD